MKTIKGALGIDPGRVKRVPMSEPPAKGSGMLGQYHRQQQQAQQQQAQRPHPQTGGPIYGQAQGLPPQTGGGYMMPQAGIGNFMQNQIGQMPQQAAGQVNPYAQAQQQMQQGQYNQMFGNAAGRMPQNVGDMTAQQRNPNYIQGR